MQQQVNSLPKGLYKGAELRYFSNLALREGEKQFHSFQGKCKSRSYEIMKVQKKFL